ncbi:hypothetical protein CTEN210_14228 [Chaetoceros tenuissimus]|uniref:Uncharacterized protein n=1 Tax=Chaetoceros tenuissimus TaxID=426638 RepID=A0AAD3HBJ5_9STRA|nr:hypothetical protein CTEN210_14228 [Chaetoceros tenuissimus]
MRDEKLIKAIDKLVGKLTALKDISVMLQDAPGNSSEDNARYTSYFDSVELMIKKTMSKLDAASSKALTLKKIKTHEQGEAVVMKIITHFPTSMNFTNKKNQLPIQDAVWKSDSLKFIPPLAIEGVKHNIGGKGKRGGLLTIDPAAVDKKNTLQLLVNLVNEFGIENHDSNGAKVLKDLKDAGLLVKQDLLDYNLLYWACVPGCKKRFELLLSIDNTQLVTHHQNGKIMAHAVIMNDNDEEKGGEMFKTYLSATFRYHSEHYGGMLFVKDDEELTAFDRALRKFGKKKVLQILRDLVPKGSDFPLLHHFAVYAPEHLNMVLRQFGHVAHVKDHSGRTLNQILLAGGTDVIDTNYAILSNMPKKELTIQDPVTGLLPFATVAVGQDNDLEFSNFLLRKNPKVMDAIVARIKGDEKTIRPQGIRASFSSDTSRGSTSNKVSPDYNRASTPIIRLSPRLSEDSPEFPSINNNSNKRTISNGNKRTLSDTDSTATDAQIPNQKKPKPFPV